MSDPRQAHNAVFPGAITLSPYQAESHRKLFLPGSRLSGAWTDTSQYFQVDQTSDVLHCRHVWWLDIGGALADVPAGRWEVSILLKCGSSAPWKDIDWGVYVEDSVSIDNPRPPTLYLSTGRNAVGSFEAAPPREWGVYAMGPITVSNPNSRVRLHIRGIESQSLNDFYFGGLELKPCCVDWRKEALLLRMLNSGVSGSKGEQDTPSTAGIFNLPRDIVVRIAQYLITPLPTENVLLLDTK